MTSDLTASADFRPRADRNDLDCSSVKTGFVKTGFSSIDDIFGGMGSGSVTLVVGPPGAGKTAMLCNAALSALRSGIPVAFFSLENSSDQIRRRLASLLSGVPLRSIGCGVLDSASREKLEDALQELDGLPLLVDDEPHKAVDQMEKSASLLREQQAVETCLVIVDYLQLTDPQYRSEMYDKCEDALHLLQEPGSFATRTGFPVLVSSQISRSWSGSSGLLRGWGARAGIRNRHFMLPLAFSGGVEGNACIDLYIALNEDGSEYDSDQPRKRRALAVSNRIGAAGMVNLEFDPRTLEFRETDFVAFE